jgi:CRISPR/Cas system-associated exonuclease Cas4 (RecB family)
MFRCACGGAHGFCGRPDADALATWFRDRWGEEMDRPIPVLFDEKKSEGFFVDAGVALLRTFHEKTDVPIVQAVEQPFAIELVDPSTGEVMEPKLIGAMDLIVEEKGKPVVVEHKTAAKRYAQWQLDFEMQPSLYAHACREIGIGEVGLCYQLLIKTKTPALQLCNIKREEKEIAEALETACQVVKAIEAGHFWRNRSWACADCQYKYKCDEGTS